jgi:hypothetical protein
MTERTVDDELVRLNHHLHVVTEAAGRMSGSLDAQTVIDALAEIAAREIGGPVVVAVTSDAERAFGDRGTPLDDNGLRVVAVVGDGFIGALHAGEQPASSPASVQLPLRARGRTLGVVVVHDAAGAHEHAALLEDLVGRAAVYLDNAVVHDATRQIGLTLQRSLLPPALPAIDGVSLAARYEPGVEGLEVGGDFYVVHPIGARQVIVAMGDVMGRGVHAAAAMGQLRSVLLTVMQDHDAPADILTRMSEIAPDATDISFATLAIARYDAAMRRLSLSSAGHPPPLLVPDDGEATFLDVAPGPPLGALPSRYEQTETTLSRGDAVVFYTDGLIERRGEDLSDGMERVRVSVAGQPRAPADLSDHLIEVSRAAGGGDDDVAVLVLSPTPGCVTGRPAGSSDRSSP